MGTTDTVLAQRLLHILDTRDVEYLVLHNASDIAEGRPISDVDTIVKCQPWKVIAKLLEEQSNLGLSLVMTWEYDFGALTSFWMSSDGSNGVQLDLLKDSDGRGRYGLRTDRAFHFADTSEWPPRLSRPAMLVYLLSKRIAKGDIDRARDVVRELHAIDCSNDLNLLSHRCQRLYSRAINGQFPRIGYRHYVKWRSRVSLLGLKRLVRSTGITVQVPTQDEDALTRLYNRFSAVLARVSLSKNNGARSVLRQWWLTRGPVLVIRSSGKSAGVSPYTSHDFSASIVQEMEQATRARESQHTLASMARSFTRRKTASVIPEVYGFPRNDVRWLTSSINVRAPAIISMKSRRFKLAWYFGQVPFIGRCMWTSADPPAIEAWRKGIDRLYGHSEMPAFGILGETGDEQKLVIVSAMSPWAVKVAVGSKASGLIEREAHEYEILRASDWPARQTAPKTIKLSEDILLLERVDGIHPRWDDERVHSWIKRELVQDSPDKGILHGDVTPWNVISFRGGFRLLDWEKADLRSCTSPTNNLLDYILRGAAAKHVKPRKVHRVITTQITNVMDALEAYREYMQLKCSENDRLTPPVAAYVEFSKGFIEARSSRV